MVKFESQIPIDDDVLNAHDVIENICEALYDMDSNYLTDLYNSLLSDKITYIGDSLWERSIEDE